MKLIFSENAWNDYLYWQRNDTKILKRINSLIKDIQRQHDSWYRQTRTVQTWLIRILLKKNNR